VSLAVLRFPIMGTQVRLPALVAQVMGRAAGMGTRARRRRDLVLLAIGGLLVDGAAAVGAAVGDSERVTGLWAGAVIGRDGRAGVVEWRGRRRRRRRGRGSW